MVVLKCKPSEDTFKRYTTAGLIYKICGHLTGEPAYKNSDILVSDVQEDGCFYITLGNGYNKEELILEVTI